MKRTARGTAQAVEEEPDAVFLRTVGKDLGLVRRAEDAVLVENIANVPTHLCAVALEECLCSVGGALKHDDVAKSALLCQVDDILRAEAAIRDEAFDTNGRSSEELGDASKSLGIDHVARVNEPSDGPSGSGIDSPHVADDRHVLE